jgi:hypothetical protein
MALTADNPMTWLLLVGAVGVYASVAMAPARLAAGVHLATTAIVAVGLGLAGYGDAAVAMVSGGAVCVLLLCGGLVMLTGRKGAEALALNGGAMVLLPLGLVLMFIGLRGKFDGLGVVLLFVLGVVGWLVETRQESGATTRTHVGAAAMSLGCALVLGAVVAVVWALAMKAGVGKGAQFAPAVMGMAILAPAAMFPLVGVSGQAAGESAERGMRLLVRSAAGLLTVVLPLAVLAGGPGRAWVSGVGLDDAVARVVVGVTGTGSGAQAGAAPDTEAAAELGAELRTELGAQPATGPATRPAIGGATAAAQADWWTAWVGYPIVSWRLDTAVFVVVGMVLLGMRLGLMGGGRLMGVVAVVGYGVYLVAGVVVSVIM